MAVQSTSRRRPQRPARRPPPTAQRDAATLRCAADLACRYASWALAPSERIAAVGLARNGQLLSETVICGDAHHIAVLPVALLQDAVALRAEALALVHNHPSGNPQPSRADLLFTARMIDACRVLGMQLVDHVIVASGGWQRIALDSVHRLGPPQGP